MALWALWAFGHLDIWVFGPLGIRILGTIGNLKLNEEVFFLDPLVPLDIGHLGSSSILEFGAVGNLDLNLGIICFGAFAFSVLGALGH